jgi:hypothetical protein
MPNLLMLVLRKTPFMVGLWQENCKCFVEFLILFLLHVLISYLPGVTLLQKF